MFRIVGDAGMTACGVVSYRFSIRLMPCRRSTRHGPRRRRMAAAHWSLIFRWRGGRCVPRRCPRPYRRRGSVGHDPLEPLRLRVANKTTVSPPGGCGQCSKSACTPLYTEVPARCPRPPTATRDVLLATLNSHCHVPAVAQSTVPSATVATRRSCGKVTAMSSLTTPRSFTSARRAWRWWPAAVVRPVTAPRKESRFDHPRAVPALRR